MLGISGVLCAHAETDADAARAATRRSATTTVTSSRQKIATPGAAMGTRTQNTTQRKQSVASGVQPRGGTNVSPRGGNVVQSARTATTSQTVTARAATNVQPRTTSSVRNAPTTVSRTATRTTIQPRADTTSATPARSLGGTVNASRAAASNASRAATRTPSSTTTRRGATSTSGRISRAAVTAEEIMSRDYTTCRKVYYDCMDEFCANKDALLKRCACSTRANEFDDVKAQLAQIEEQLLDFNQRLLTVNMDAEDANALFQATEGELAFNKEDESSSKQMLDEISKKLNTTFEDTTLNQNLGAISLSLNTDAAFDTVDSLMGASTAAKSGRELYNAALPVCREMAAEVCTPDELEIAASGYLVAIEQDCNTVAASYAAQQDQARQRIREGSALLDMSRLDIYQTRNSDDILTCKKKMLEMLTDSSVCGENLGKCLDTTGQYIDPSTGQAFLTKDLANLSTLITRPGINQTWTSVPTNQTFVKYLDGKKIFLEPAMENCQDIADYVWDAFIEDALSQIKIAQEAKLEDMRQSCTTLTTQCMTDTMKSLSDFDARALSTFGVEADYTVNQMCSSIKTACTALLGTTGGGDDDWDAGMTDIAATKTYETIMKTCREVGRNCIIQSCKSISGNFGLCTDIYTSVNRKSILNRTACWNEVKNCVAAAGATSIPEIMKQLAASNEYKSISVQGTVSSETQQMSLLTGGVRTTNDTGTYGPTFYEYLYGSNTFVISSTTAPTDTTGNYVEDVCSVSCKAGNESVECQTCRLAERIWGNCEVASITTVSATGAHNKIKIPTNGEETLMSWFAHNTGTEEDVNSCSDTSCPSGTLPVHLGGGYICAKEGDAISFGTNDLVYCKADNQFTISDGSNPTIPDEEKPKNCCSSGVYDTTDGKNNGIVDCCANGNVQHLEINGIGYHLCAPTGKKAYHVLTTGNNHLICMSDTDAYMDTTTTNCGPSSGNSATQGQGDETTVDENKLCFPSGRILRCNGTYMHITDNTNSGKYNVQEYTHDRTGAEKGATSNMKVFVQTGSSTYKYKGDADFTYKNFTVSYE